MDIEADTPPPDTTPIRDRAGLTTAEAAKFLGVGYSTMKGWRCDGDGPRYAKIGSTVLYRPADLDDFVEKHLIGKRRRPRRTT